MDLNVTGKVAFITGAGEGIGEIVALMLAEEGAHVALGDFDAERVEDTANKVKALGARCLWSKLDVTDQQQVNESVQKAVQDYGKIDMLVHIPGRGERKPFTASTKEDWDFAVQLNLYGVLYSAKAVMDQMIKQGSGSMVFTVSDAGKVGETNNPVYSAAKGGVIALSKALARELGRYNIRVNCVALSAMNTPGGLRFRESVKDMLGSDPAELEKKILRSYAIRRFGNPQDAADALCFLVSDRASWITGQTLSVNGGYCMI